MPEKGGAGATIVTHPYGRDHKGTPLLENVGLSMGGTRCISRGSFEPPDFLLKKIYYIYI